MITRFLQSAMSFALAVFFLSSSAFAEVKMKILYDLSAEMTSYETMEFEKVPQNIIDLYKNEDYLLGSFKLRRYLGEDKETGKINPRAWYLYARAQLELNDFDLATKSANRALAYIEGYPFDAELYAIIVYAYLLEKSDFKTAYEYVERIKESCSDAEVTDCKLSDLLVERIEEYRVFEVIATEQN